MKGTGAEALAAEAQGITRRTHYQNEAVVDEKTGTDEGDCAAFVGLLLESVAPEHLVLIPKGADERYPRASELFDFLHAKPTGWSHVESLAKVERGDVIAWRPAKGAAGRDTGHVLVVAQPPVLDKATHTWMVHGYDSSASAHHDDSRERGGKFHPGVGQGAVRFKVDSSGAPVAFQLRPHADFHTAPIVVARLQELPTAKKRATHRHEEAPHRDEEAPPPANLPGPVVSGQRIARAAAADEVLAADEFAFTTYALAASTAMLLPPTTIACWGPGETIRASLGQGTTTYTLVGGVVLKNA